MHVLSLRDAFARLHIISQSITFNNRYSFEMLRENTGCQQPGHTPTNHDSMMCVKSILLCYFEIHTCYSSCQYPHSAVCIRHFCGIACRALCQREAFNKLHHVRELVTYVLENTAERGSGVTLRLIWHRGEQALLNESPVKREEEALLGDRFLRIKFLNH